jgi:hypothetical protein
LDLEVAHGGHVFAVACRSESKIIETSLPQIVDDLTHGTSGEPVAPHSERRILLRLGTGFLGFFGWDQPAATASVVEDRDFLVAVEGVEDFLHVVAKIEY